MKSSKCAQDARTLGSPLSSFCWASAQKTYCQFIILLWRQKISWKWNLIPALQLEMFPAPREIYVLLASSWCDLNVFDYTREEPWQVQHQGVAVHPQHGGDQGPPGQALPLCGAGPVPVVISCSHDRSGLVLGEILVSAPCVTGALCGWSLAVGC